MAELLINFKRWQKVKKITKKMYADKTRSQFGSYGNRGKHEKNKEK